MDTVGFRLVMLIYTLLVVVDFGTQLNLSLEHSTYNKGELIFGHIVRMLIMMFGLYFPVMVCHWVN